MSKAITEQATNKLNIVGKIIDCTFREGVTTDNTKYESANYTLRVEQTYNGKTEVSEIPCSTFATPTTSTGAVHPGYRSIQELKNMHTIQDYGEEAASRIKITAGNIQENAFVSKSGQLITNWRVRVPYIGVAGNASDIASFNVDIFIMDMHDEIDKSGEPTGRLIVKGGIVQYGGILDVIDFIVEGNDAVDYISRNWNINDTVNAGGRVRITSQEVNMAAESAGSWGESLPETSTRMVRELVITRGSDEAFDEEFAYDAADIKKAYNERKAKLEQLQINAKQSATKARPNTPNKYSWE